jgi:hypothetical protein
MNDRSAGERERLMLFLGGREKIGRGDEWERGRHNWERDWTRSFLAVIVVEREGGNKERGQKEEGPNIMIWGRGCLGKGPDMTLMTLTAARTLYYTT